MKAGSWEGHIRRGREEAIRGVEGEPDWEMRGNLITTVPQGTLQIMRVLVRGTGDTHRTSSIGLLTRDFL